MNKDKVEAERKQLIELQNVSEKISDLISDGKFQLIIPLEKQRLDILKSFNVKPSDSGIKLLQNILEKTKKDIDIIENEKLKLNKNFEKAKYIFLPMVDNFLYEIMSKPTLDFQHQLPITSDDLLTILKENQIDFKLYEHKPLNSVSESKTEQETIFPLNSNNVHIKNLYLRDKKKKKFFFNYM